MNLLFPLCWFNRHSPKRSRVKWDGLNFVGICRNCKKPIRRRDKGRWEKEWMSGPASLG